MPSKTPEAAHLLDKPDMTIYCPASGKKLRLKDLIPVRFTRCAEDEEGFARDPVTKDTFTNASGLVVIRSTGTVLGHSHPSWKPCPFAHGLSKPHVPACMHLSMCNDVGARVISLPQM